MHKGDPWDPHRWSRWRYVLVVQIWYTDRTRKERGVSLVPIVNTKRWYYLCVGYNSASIQPQFNCNLLSFDVKFQSNCTHTHRLGALSVYGNVQFVCNFSSVVNSISFSHLFLTGKFVQSQRSTLVRQRCTILFPMKPSWECDVVCAVYVAAF